ncbi:MAG: hypothetical protein PVG83_05735 [Acidimicrobiia bacterium]
MAAGLGLIEVALVAGLCLLLVAVVLAMRRRSSFPHSMSSRSSGGRRAAEEELNLLKGGSLWGDVYAPRFVSGRRLRRVRRR